MIHTEISIKIYESIRVQEAVSMEFGNMLIIRW